MATLLSFFGILKTCVQNCVKTSSEKVKNVPLKYHNISFQQCESLWFSNQSIPSPYKSYTGLSSNQPLKSSL